MRRLAARRIESQEFLNKKNSRKQESLNEKNSRMEEFMKSGHAYIESMHPYDAGIHPSVFIHPCFAGMHTYQGCMQNVQASILFKDPCKLITNSREHESVGGPPFLWIHANFAWAMRADLL